MTDTSRSGDLVKMLRAGDLCGLTLAADRIEALEANLNQMTAICHGWRLQSGEQEERIEALEAEVERLREALRFYASDENHKYLPHAGCSQVEAVGGEIARAALGVDTV